MSENIIYEGAGDANSVYEHLNFHGRVRAPDIGAWQQGFPHSKSGNVTTRYSGDGFHIDYVVTPADETDPRRVRVIIKGLPEDKITKLKEKIESEGGSSELEVTANEKT